MRFHGCSLIHLWLVALILVASTGSVSAITIPAHARGGRVYRDAQADAQAHYHRVHLALQAQRASLTSTKGVRAAEPLSFAAAGTVMGPNTTVNYLAQRVDHQDVSRGTFLQRWWVDMSAVTPCAPSSALSPSSGSCRQRAMLFVHGEGPASSSPTGYAMEYGASIGAYLFALEHRFYGDSLPGNLTYRRALDTLTVDNVLSDLQYFKREMVRRFFHNDSESVVWYVVGGSYSGALSVWLRQAYPHDFAAAWSSSGVVNAVFDFTQFDAHLRKVLSGECAQALRAVLGYVEDVYDRDGPFASADRRAALDAIVRRPAYYSDTDVQWMLTDGTAMAVQYGRKEQLCERLLDVEDGFSWHSDGRLDARSMQMRLTTVVALLTDLWGPNFTQSCYYSGACLGNASYAALWPTGNYAWVFQCCTELAYWQVSYPNSLRAAGISTSYFMAQCRAAFGQETYPNTFLFNARHGGASPQTDHVVATHGGDDPWLPAGVLRPLAETYPVLTAHCAGCGHCADLHAPRADGRDPPALVTQRTQIAAYLTAWLNITDASRRADELTVVL